MSNLPSKDLEPSQLWAQIIAMPRPSRVVEFPRKGPDGKAIGELSMVVLTQEEQILCSAEAERYTKRAIQDLPKNNEAQIGYENVYNNSAAVEVLFNACKRRDDISKPFFPSRDALRRFLTADEVGVLMVHYYTVQAELGPIVAHLTKDELEVWITRLGEGGERFPLDLLSWDALKDLAFSLACRIHKSAMGTPSLGLPPADESPPSPLPPPQTI